MNECTPNDNNMSRKSISVKSLSEYIDAIKLYDLKDCYYRGENKKHLRISSSLLRSYYNVADTPSIEGVYNYLLSEYYREVGYELDTMQTNNFIAFSQHHGLKTNLIDFTLSPLISLFFACDGKQDDNLDGYVYVIRKTSTVDASLFLDECSLKKIEFKNIYDDVINDDTDFMVMFSWLLDRHHKLSPYISKLIDIIRDDSDLVQSNRFNDGLFLDGSKCDDETVQYVRLLQMYLKDEHGQNNNSNVVFPPMPYFIYRTALKFDRIRNQSGIFIYQGFTEFFHKSKDDYYYMIQDVIPDFTIQIDGRAQILEELDMVGINKRFVYGDYDNTAMYINSKQYLI